MAENGFSRVSRHSPTTYAENCFIQDRYETQASNTFINSEGINKSFGGFVDYPLR